MAEEDLLYRVEENVAHITINREQQRNAITPQAINLFLEYLDKAERDDQVRAVVNWGQPGSYFSTNSNKHLSVYSFRG